MVLALMLTNQHLLLTFLTRKMLEIYVKIGKLFRTDKIQILQLVVAVIEPALYSPLEYFTILVTLKPLVWERILLFLELTNLVLHVRKHAANLCDVGDLQVYQVLLLKAFIKLVHVCLLLGDS